MNTKTEKQARSYEELRIQANTGWNTWYSESMTTHALLPYGFGISLNFKNFADPELIRNLKVGNHGLRPGSRSWDGSYTSLTFSCGDTPMLIESTTQNGEQYILVTPGECKYRTPALAVEADLLWNKEGCLFKKGDTIGATFPDGKTITLFSSGKPDAFHMFGSRNPFFSVTLDEPVVVSTVPATVEEVKTMLETEKAKVLAEEESYGINKGAYQAMRSCMAWDTIYEPSHDRICSPVSREWNETWGGYVLFCWDTYFGALLSTFGSKELAYLNAFAITNEMTEKGFVPNFALSDDCKSRDRSQPPVGSMTVLRLWEKFGDDWVVKEIFDKLYGWNCWFTENRVLPDNTLCWGSQKYTAKLGRYFEVYQQGELQGAKYESGLDNSPMYDDAAFDEETGLMLLSDVGLTGLYIQDCRCLIKLAEIAEKTEVIPVLEERLAKTEAAMATLWNPETGIFENRDAVTGAFSHRISPTNLYSLYASCVTDEQKKSMAEKYLLDPEELGGKYMLPSISRKDPAYPDQDYWRGRIWAPMHYLVYEALCAANMEEEKQILAQSSRALLLHEWEAHGHVHENYNGTTGWGCDVVNSNNFYHWGGLLGYVAIDAAK